jgi:hypothetical protein
VSIIVVMLIQSKYFSIHNSISSIPITDYDEAILLISRLRSNDKSLYGLRYRSMICTIVRNDPHILEFILRHLRPPPSKKVSFRQKHRNGDTCMGR